MAQLRRMQKEQAAEYPPFCSAGPIPGGDYMNWQATIIGPVRNLFSISDPFLLDLKRI